MKELLKYQHKLENPTILDLGANAGLEGIRLFKEFGSPNSKVILVEPMIDNVKHIITNIQENNLENNCFIEHCAIDVATAAGYMEFGYHHSDSMFGRINGSLDQFNWRTWNYNGKAVVRTKMLSQICEKPNIVKIDIERHEYVILPTLVMNPHIQIIFCELHRPCYPLNVKRFINNCLQDTDLRATGYFTCVQHQNGEADSYTEIEAPETIHCSDYKYVIIEKKNDN